MSTQASPHFCRPLAQSKLHIASRQRAVAEAGALQTLSHLPQFLASLFTSTQDPSHEVFAPHSLVHLPAWQTSVAAQA